MCFGFNWSKISSSISWFHRVIYKHGLGPLGSGPSWQARALDLEHPDQFYLGRNWEVNQAKARAIPSEPNNLAAPWPTLEIRSENHEIKKLSYDLLKIYVSWKAKRVDTTTRHFQLYNQMSMQYSQKRRLDRAYAVYNRIVPYDQVESAEISGFPWPALVRIPGIMFTNWNQRTI